MSAQPSALGVSTTGSLSRLGLPLVAWSSLALLSSTLLFAVYRDEPCVIDEPEWITTGEETWRLVRTGASPEEWTGAYDALQLGDWGHKNPALGKLLVGMAAHAARRPADPPSFRSAWGTTGAILPPLHMLRAARLVVAAFGALALVLSFLVARRIVSTPAAALAGPVLLLCAPSFVFHATRVYMDIPQLAFALGAVWCALRFIDRAGLRWIVASATLVGLSCAVKLSSGVYAGALFLVLPFIQRSGERILGAAILAIVPLLVFVAVNPYLYQEPVTRVVSVVRSWGESKRAQQADAMLASTAVRSRTEAFDRTLRGGLLQPSRAPNADGSISTPLRRFASWVPLLFVAALVLARRRLLVVVPPSRRRLWLLLLGGALFASLADVADPLFAVLAVLTFLPQADDASSARRFVSAVWMAVFVGTVLWLPFAWDRYYLPVLVLSAPLLCVGLDRILRSVRVDLSPPRGGADVVALALGLAGVAVVSSGA